MLIFTDKSFSPNFQKHLAGIADNYLFHGQYELKHPLAIYNTSFGKIESDLEDFFKIYKTISLQDFKTTGKNDDKVRETLKRYKTFLYSLREHLDDCFHIVKILIPPRATFKKERVQYIWLKQNVKDPAVISFLQTIDNYKGFLDNLVNELKHNNGIINGIAYYEDSTNEFSLGYYVANVINDAYVPVPNIHQKNNGENTAFSLSRDIRFNIYNIFFVSEQLIKLAKALNIPAKISISSTEVVEKRRILYEDIFNLPLYFFPDEYKKEVPSISITRENILKLEYPSRFTPKKLPPVMNFVQYHSTDGKTAKYGLLYGVGPRK